LNVFALESWAFELAILPAYMLVFNETVLMLILRQKKQHKVYA
jgi:hypothetical protein